MTFEPDQEIREACRDLGRCLIAMGDYRNQAVLAGGLATIIYRCILTDVNVHHQPLITFDTDMNLTNPLETINGLGLNDRMKEAGFEIYTAGEGESRACFYKHRDRNPGDFSPIHVEFLSSLPKPVAGEYRSARALELQPGLNVQALPYIEMLFHEPIKVRSNQVPVLEIEENIQFQLANPALYIVQKILARKHRSEHKKEKDLAYIFDVVVLHRAMWQQMAETISNVAGLQAKWVERALNDLWSLFSTDTSDGPLAVVNERETYDGPVVSGNSVNRIMRQFLNTIAGNDRTEQTGC